jgi:hypothetical protein
MNIRQHLMKLTFLACAIQWGLALAQNADMPIIIEGPEQSQVDTRKVNGGLRPTAGVRSFEVFHANKEQPELSDGKGWTYHHHVDLAVWKGRLYVGWNSCEINEDEWPSRELLSSSTDGQHWAKPVEMFPMGVSMPQRMYFYVAGNGRMLITAGLRNTRERLAEAEKGPMVVRELKPDHTLGEVHTLRRTDQVPPDMTIPPMYTAAPDKGLVEACEDLLANTTFLEQQDYGVLLGERRMSVYDSSKWTNPASRRAARDFARAMSFFHRKDGALVGVGKTGFVIVSKDEGKTWSEPVRPPTLVTGGAKVWGQRTADGRYALVYNPHRVDRFPLVIVHGDDGVTFGGMSTIWGEKIPQRYPGERRRPGPQYTRGISEWSSDGSWKDSNALWIVYSVNKEDIWVSRIELPIRAAP